MSVTPERAPSGGGVRSGTRTPLIALTVLLLIALIAAGALFFTLQQTQTDLEDTRRTSTQAVNLAQAAATEAAGTSVAEIDTLELAGTQGAVTLEVISDALAFNDDQLGQAFDNITTLEGQGTTAADQLITATAVFDQSQQDIATLEGESTAAADLLTTATADYNIAQASIATLSAEGRVAEQRLATATAVFEDSQAQLATQAAESTAAALQFTATYSAIEGTATQVDQQLADLQRTATQSGEDLSSLGIQATQNAQQFTEQIATNDAASIALLSTVQANVPPISTDLLLVADALSGGANPALAGLAQSTTEIEVAFPTLTIDLSDEDNLSQREWYPGEFSNFAVRAEVIFGPGVGEDECGFSFRDSNDDNFYTVRVNRDANVRFVARIEGEWQESVSGDGSAILTGDGRVNQLLLVGVGERFILYINGQRAGEFTDSALESGRLGLLAATFANSEETNCTFRNAWSIDLGDAQIVSGGGGGEGSGLPAASVITADNANQLVNVQTFGMGQTLNVAWSTDGNTVAVASSMGIWLYDSGDLVTPRLLLDGHSRSVRVIAFSPDSRYLASGSDDETVRLWEVQTGEQIMVLQGHTNLISSVSFSPDGELLASTSWDQTTRVWDIPDGSLRYVLEGHERPINAAAFSGDSSLLATAGADGDIILWEMRRGRDVALLEGHRSAINVLAFSGSILASGSDDDTVRLWNVEREREIEVLEGHTGNINALAFSSDGTRLASGSSDGTARWWDVESADEALLMETYRNDPVSIIGIAISPDAAQVLTVGGENILYVHRLDGDTLQETTPYGDFTSAINRLAYHPDGTRLAAAYNNGIVQVFDLAQNDWERRFAGFDRVTHTVAFSPDGSLIAFAGASGKIFLQETETGDEVAVLEGHINEISSLAFSPDGQTLASGSYDESTILWDVRRERQIEQFYGHIDQVFAVAFSPDGRLLATGDASGSVIVWNVQQAEQVRTLVFNTAAITDLAFSPDNRFLAISSRDGTVQLIEVEELLFGGGMRQSLYETFDLPGYGFSVAFSPDGSLLLGTVGDLVNSENVIYVWDVESGDIVTVLRGHKNWAMSAQFSPDGSQIASASLDGSIRLWSLD